MIEARSEPLSIEAQDKLHRLFNGEMFAPLVKLAEAQEKLHEAEALKAATQAAQDSPLKIEATDKSLRQAARYKTFREVLTEFKETATYVTVKLS